MKRRLAEDLALLTGTINYDNLEQLVINILTEDKSILARYHKYVTDPEVLMSILLHVTKTKKALEK